MTQVDLSQLRIDESATKPKRPIGPRVLGGAVIALLAAVALTFLWPLLRPARVVTTAPVRLADVTSPTSSVATAEAVGWVEPEPYPVEIKPLVSGRVRAIHVLEGHVVKAGETVLASLDSAPLLAAHDRAKALVAERDSELAVAAADRLVRDHHVPQLERRAYQVPVDRFVDVRARRLRREATLVQVRVRLVQRLGGEVRESETP